MTQTSSSIDVITEPSAALHQSLYFRTALYSLIGLVMLGVAWEWFLAPLRPNGSWMVLKVLPLIPAIKGLLSKKTERQLYTLQWLSMLILLYFTEGVMRAYSDKGASALCAGLEITLCVTCFIGCIAFLRPYKRAAKAAAKAAARAEATPSV